MNTQNLSNKLHGFFFPEEETNVFDEHRFLQDLDSGVFRDRFVMGVSNANSGKWDLQDFSETPHAIFAGASGSGKSLGGAFTVGTHFFANCDQTMYFIMDIAKGAGEYSALFKFPNVYTALNMNGYDALEGCHRIIDLIHSESVSRQDVFGEIGVPNLKAYESVTGKTMPRIVVVMEEFHMFPSAIEFDKNVDKKNSTANKLKTLLRVARSQGIFFVFASQRTTQVDVPKHIVSNILNKMMFKVPAGESQYVLGKMDAAYIKGSQKGRCVTENGTNQFPAFGSLTTPDKISVEFQDCLAGMAEAYYKPLIGECARLNDKLVRDYLNGKDNKELYKNKKLSELADTLEMIKGELAIEVIHESMGHTFKQVNTKTDRYGISGIATKQSGEDFVIYYDKKGDASARTVEGVMQAARERGTLSGIIYTPSNKMSPAVYKFAKECGILVFTGSEIMKICELIDYKKPMLAESFYTIIPTEGEEDQGGSAGAGPKQKKRIIYVQNNMKNYRPGAEYLKEDAPPIEKEAASVETSRRRLAKKTDAEILADIQKLEGLALARSMQQMVKANSHEDFSNPSPLDVFKKYTTKYVSADYIDEALRGGPVNELFKRHLNRVKDETDEGGET